MVMGKLLSQNQNYCIEHFKNKMSTTISILEKNKNNHFSHISLTVEFIELIHIKRNSAFSLKTANTMHHNPLKFAHDWFIGHALTCYVSIFQ